MNKAWPGSGKPDNEFLGPGAVYFNYDEPDEFMVGLTKGGNEFNDNVEFRERESDADIAPVKGARDMVMMRPQLTVRSLKINVQNFLKYYAGMKAGAVVDGIQSVYRTIDLSGSYIKNVAWVGQDRLGNNMAVVVKNALGDNPFTLSMAKGEEIVPEVIFTGHVDPATFDPEDETTYPYRIDFEAATVTFTIKDAATPTPAAVAGATIKLDDGQSKITDVEGVATFVCTYGKVGYSVSKSGYTTVSGTITVDAETEAVAVTMPTAG